MPLERTGVRFTGDWDKFISRLDQGAQRRVLAESDKATQQVALMAQARIREEMRSGRFQANAGLTLVFKRSTKPLIDRGQLFQAITQKKIERAKYFVGVLKTNRGYNIAKTVHDGVTIPVTAKMRWLFTILYQVTKEERDGIFPSRARTLSPRARELAAIATARKMVIPMLRPSTRYIRIPRRPFIDQALADPQFQMKAKTHWTNAIVKALKGGRP